MFPTVSLDGNSSDVGVDLVNDSMTPPAKCEFFEFLGEKLCFFWLNNKRMVCLLQIYEKFLKHLVGGLHTIYTKMRRLNIHPIVCNVEQVRALRVVGAIQNGVNRCKLIDLCDLERLFVDCSDTRPRPGRPAKARGTLNGYFPHTDLDIAQQLPNAEITSNIPPISLEPSENGIGTITNVPDSLSFFTNFLPINPPNHLLHKVFPILQQPPPSSVLQNNVQTSEGGGEKSEDCSSTLTNENQNSCSDEKQDSSSNSSTNSNKPSGSNSETDDSFDREKSLSATIDQDLGIQRTSSPSNQSLQFLLIKLISLMETTESSFKSHCERLNELSRKLHNQIHDVVDRERAARLELYLQRQKTALYQRRYITGRYLNSHRTSCQRRRRKHGISTSA
ncbi:Dachshund-like protein 1 [Aphelenchoides besseyi]|nr:Dachshund-like protein 1 [Aphelenchoides besseyi]KAI6235100.1 Dachshund-like protein 1 [Aphelenchoides besseyi]